MLDEIPMPTEELFFLDFGRARMFAVEALLVSRARAELTVYDAYFGLTSCYLSAYLEAQIEKMDGKSAASMLTFLRKCEKQRTLIQKEGMRRPRPIGISLADGTFRRDRLTLLVQ